MVACVAIRKWDLVKQKQSVINGLSRNRISSPSPKTHTSLFLGIPCMPFYLVSRTKIIQICLLSLLSPHSHNPASWQTSIKFERKVEVLKATYRLKMGKMKVIQNQVIARGPILLMPNEGKGKDCSALSHCVAVAHRLISSNTEPLQHAVPLLQSSRRLLAKQKKNMWRRLTRPGKTYNFCSNMKIKRI